MKKLLIIATVLLTVIVAFGIANIRNTNKATAAAERAATAANAAQEEIKNLDTQVQNLADEKEKANAALSEIVKKYNGSQADNRATIENLKKRLKETPVIIPQPPPSIATAPHATPTPRIETGNGSGGISRICDSLVLVYEKALEQSDNTIRASLQTNAELNALFDGQRLQTEQANARILANINEIRQANADEQRHNQRKAKRKRIVQTITATVTGIAAGVLINASR